MVTGLRSPRPGTSPETPLNHPPLSLESCNAPSQPKTPKPWRISKMSPGTSVFSLRCKSSYLQLVYTAKLPQRALIPPPFGGLVAQWYPLPFFWVMGSLYSSNQPQKRVPYNIATGLRKLHSEEQVPGSGGKIIAKMLNAGIRPGAPARAGL